MIGTMTGVVSDGMKTMNGCVALNVNLDTVASVDLSPVKFDREGVGDGISHD